MTAIKDYSDCKTTIFVDSAALATGYLAPLSSFAILAFSGADAISFLHRMLTNDMEHLRDTEARLAAYCTPQGRMLASFLAWKNKDGILLQLTGDIQPALQKRLKMYVLRDKVTIDCADCVQLGLGGQKAAEALTPWFTRLPESPYTKIDNEHGSLIRVADAFGAPRYLWVMPPDNLPTVWPALSARLNAHDDRVWKLAEIEAGIPHIVTATQEKFVAQMVNYERIGGVNFRKGCYPGQEVVARLQHRGKTPRRMRAAHIALSNGDVEAGTEVYASDDAGQPCGLIVNAERAAPDRIACLVSLRYPLADGLDVHLGAPDGPILQFTPLPYSIEDSELA